jgi:hypothetical protein
MDEIKCPKCGSTQLTTDKKGFSGKKAVAGAVLTGGIGLLAGTIGSNKIKITCLKCGTQFKPGEDLDSAQTKKIQQQKAMKSPGFWIFFILILIGFIFLLKSCFGSSSNHSQNTVSTEIADSLSSVLNKYYEIEKVDDRTPIINLFVYVSINDSSKIKLINELLINKYNSESKNYLEVSYFDKKGVGKIYQDKVNNEKTSDKEAAKLYNHLIANYSFNPSTGYVKLFFNHSK